MPQTASYTQDHRLIAFDAPSLGKDVLLLQELTGQEGLSRLFSYELDLLAYENDSLSFEKVVGKKVSLKLQRPDGSLRHISGYVSRFTQGETDERLFTHYHAQVVPWLWFLTLQADCRIFQNLSVPDIISQVFDLYPLHDYRLSLGKYQPLEYRVQYRETSFNFVSRLMEEFGIYYYFDHSIEGKHTMVLCDPSTSLPTSPSSPISYETRVGGLEDPEVISNWHVGQEVRTGKYSLTDYNFITPSTSLMANEPTIVNLAACKDLENYDYPGPHTTKDDGLAAAKVHMQEEEAAHLVVSAAGNARALGSGYLFTLKNHYRSDQNTTYLVTEARHFASAGQTYTTAGTLGGETYSNHFTCIPANVQYRPPRVTPKPHVQGPQPALVVGKAGEEIWVDNYGRVIVQFYWDRQGKKNENSSCWIRVSQPWAGNSWGGMWIPRIGQEVLVSFLEGDPDRPVIVGRVYNAEQMPPYQLPDHQTVSTFKSRSSKGGTGANFNEIRFEDKKDSEQVFIKAEKEMDLRVQTNSREFIGASRHLIVTANQIEQVKAEKHGHVQGKLYEKNDSDVSLEIGGKQLQKIGGSKSTQVGRDFMESVSGNASQLVSGDQREQVLGKLSLQVSGSRHERTAHDHNVRANNMNLIGGTAVVIQGESEGVFINGPGGFISITAQGITIHGHICEINCGGASKGAEDANPDSPENPESPTDPKDPDTADDGSKFGKLS